MTTAGRVAQIWIYPVKSLGGTARDRVRLAPTGPEGDRTSAVVDAATGEVLRGRHAPGLAALAPTGDPAADERAVAQALGREVRVRPVDGGSGADAAAVHLVSRQAVERAAGGDVPEGCSADDPRANVLLDMPDDDERGWVGRTVRIGEAELAITRTPKHCLGVYAEVRRPGEIAIGDVVLLQPRP
ncbi:MOSC N-terminal beta barrel domain-containing protein [Blastococcus sp. VKM Ac-2987]|uniref:MOSC N-terminal beta barrel domain-containing protein n=1 Tax=Blastococcus sp. VKM Ac-2987 TaxID=3004141 RepID=UPI0022AB784F|nr:MOSC N-terminal beta barrel domain-containing protein [Blastococcus sp. VKM Ac-2987]MCZ2856976.1 MOSC N-terminal beta barrel domain-containing protein [Blastococcus sp. VKM Ac-2987]